MGDMEDMTEKWLLVASNLQSCESEQVVFFPPVFLPVFNTPGGPRTRHGWQRLGEARGVFMDCV